MGNPSRLNTCRHNHVLGLFCINVETVQNAFLAHAAAFHRLKPASQIIGDATGEIFQRFNVIFAQTHQHSRGQAFHRRQIIADPHFLTLRIELFIFTVQMVAGTVLDFLGGFLVKALNRSNFFDRHISHFFNRGKAFRGQKLGNHFINVQRLHEQSCAIYKFGLSALAFLRFSHNINVPTGQLRREPHILPAATNSQAQLLIRDHHFNALHIFVQNHFGHLRRGQSIHYESRRVRRPRNNIDFFALQFINHGLHAAAAHTNTSADRINTRVIRNHTNFSAASRVASYGTHFNHAIINFRHFLHKQFQHKGWVSSR